MFAGGEYCFADLRALGAGRDFGVGRCAGDGADVAGVVFEDRGEQEMKGVGEASVYAVQGQE